MLRVWGVVGGPGHRQLIALILTLFRWTMYNC
jgi:hypothetical protein